MPVGHETVSAQAEEYLEAICRIQDRGEPATPTELAHELAIAPPSVLGMLQAAGGAGAGELCPRGRARCSPSAGSTVRRRCGAAIAWPSAC